jgi:hypothetical protein
MVSDRDPRLHAQRAFLPVIVADMPLQNRVDPWGELFADPARGTLMGNRGGRLHDGARTLTRRRWVNRAWICCVLDFNARHRRVWGDSYSELFFLDEVTALSAGHRPCFECRRKEAQGFADGWRRAQRLHERPRAADMDIVLHAERLDDGAKRRHRLPFADLPDGAMVVWQNNAAAVRGEALLRWTPEGYVFPTQRPRGGDADVLTPRSIVGVLREDYQPRWHASAAR